MVQRAVGVVQAEEQLPDARAVLVDAESRDDAVGGTQMLHLQPAAVALAVGILERLGHHAVEPGALELVEPPSRDRIGPWSAA